MFDLATAEGCKAELTWVDDDYDDLLGLAARGWITTHTYIHTCIDTVKEN